MDQSSHSRSEGFANSGMYADHQQQQQYNGYDNLYSSAGPNQSSYNDNWGVNSSNFLLPQSRAQAPSPSWASHNANHNLHGASHNANANSQPSPYARSVNQSPTPYGQQGFGNFDTNQNFQYQQSQPQYDPALFQSSHGQALNNYSTTKYETPNTGTIAPQALQNEYRQSFGSKPSFTGYSNQPGSYPMPNNTVDQTKLIANIPGGAPSDMFSIIDFDSLSRVTNSTRMGSFVNVGHEALNFDINKAAHPAYTARRSRNDLRKAAGSDAKLLAKIGKKSTKLQRTTATPRSLQAGVTAAAQAAERIKYEGESSSDESSSDDDESSYTSDDEPEPSPLPSKRPDNPKDQTEYDTIKALWRSKGKSVSSDSIRKGLVDFWEIAKTIRDRWKADATALEEATKKGQKSQLPTLQSRVQDQRDMIEVAFKAALKHGHRSIVAIMSENEALIYLCYQFLLDRHKADDYNSVLPRTMLELMTLWNSLTEERIDKTHLNKVLVRFAKNGDAKTKYYTNKITSNGAVASKQAKEKAASAPSKKETTTTVKTESPKQRAAEPVAGVKRPAGGAAEGSAAKKVATGSAKTNGATTAKSNGLPKKASSTVDSAKPSTAAAPATKTKTVTAKPSGIFSSLSAAKKPGASTVKSGATGTSTASKLAEKKANAPVSKPAFSFAETMASLAKPKEEKPAQPKPEKQLPPETPEEKAKRLRKESRRHLRVSFKPEDELTEVRFFTHDPDEELGHDASQMRDVSDVGGEGRMFKHQHQMMDMDDEDETTEEKEKDLVAFKEPGLIDFKDVDSEERARNYEHRGGGELQVESPERAARDYYDANNLIVIYTSPEEIPANPREPSNPHNGEPVENVKNFGVPEDHFATRARQKRASQSYHWGAQQQHQRPGQNTAPPQFDLSKPAGLTNQPPNMQQSYAPPQNQQQPPQFDIKQLLDNLKQANPNQPTPPPPNMAALPPNFQPPPMMPGMQPPPPQQQQPAQGAPDLAAILAAIGQQPGAAQAPTMGGGFGMPVPPPPMNFGGQQYGNQQQPQWQGQGKDDQGFNRQWRTKTCSYWQKGQCNKGDKCTYKHSE